MSFKAHTHVRARENIANSYKKFADTRTSHALTLTLRHTHTRTHAHTLNTQAPACKSQRGFFYNFFIFYVFENECGSVCVCLWVYICM